MILDEWSENTLKSDMAKSVLQGGFMVKSVKHQTPKRINNTAPFYITTNVLPNLVQRMYMFNAKLYVSRQHLYRPLPLMQTSGCV